MPKRKVTLSIDNKVYDNFKSYCDENAIMLSKRIEIFMKSLAKSKKIISAFLLFFLMLVVGVYALQFSDLTQSDFNGGTYLNTIHNGTGVVLSGSNLTGNYTSRVFDAGSLSRWEAVSATKVIPTKEYLFVVDASGAVYKSNNSAISWVQTNSSYGRATATSDLISYNNYLFAFSGSYHEVWRSADNGVSWAVVNSTFTTKTLLNAKANSNSIYAIAGAVGEVWRSADNGSSWTLQGDFNGASSSSAKGMAIDQSGNIFVVDGSGGVFKSANQGVSWTTQNSSYGGGSGTDDMGVDSSGNLYILFNKEVYKSSDSGVSWTIVNNSFTPFSADGLKIIGDDSNNLYIIDGGDRVWKSTNSGVSWTNMGDFNGAVSSNALGFTFVRKATNMTFQMRNCSSSDCSDGVWQNVNLGVINLTSRYFQYGVFLTSEEAGLSPILYNVSLNYSVLDNSPPVISITSPVNGSNYSSSSITLSFTAIDPNLQSCWRSIDNGVNSSLPGCTGGVISGFLDGQHTITVYANDSLGNKGLSSVSFRVDTSAPVYSAISYNLPSSYSQSSSSFNISWSDSSSISSVLFESNISGSPANYSMQNIAGSVYQFSSILPAGTFYWKSYAVDSLGNLNSTTQQVFSISKAANPIYLYLNGYQSDLTLGYGSSVNATTSSLVDGVALSRDSVLVSNPDISVLAAGIYVYNATSPGNENYTSNSTLHVLNVTRAVPSLYLLLNGVQSDLSLTYGSSVNATAYETNTGDSDVTYRLFLNGTEVASPFLSVLSPGSYNFTYLSDVGQNYSSLSVTRTVSVGRASPDLRLYLNGAESDSEIVYGTAANVSVSPMVDAKLYRNGVEITSPDTSVLAAGIYNYTYSFAGNENYSSFSVARTLTVDKAVPDIAIVLNGLDSDIALNVGETLIINASSSVSSLNLSENGALILQGQNVGYVKDYLSNGIRTWTAAAEESQNYSSYSRSHSVSVVDANSPIFSNIKTSPASSTVYLSGRDYMFNISWTHVSGISEVVFSFDGQSYNYSSGDVLKNGDEYYISLNDLSAGSHSYGWYANSTTGNEAATPSQTYVIDKAVAALFLMFSPSNSIDYGDSMAVSCSANNLESSPVLTRNVTTVSNPDTSIISAGGYNYACTAAATQNYTSASTTGFLSVNKASPTLSLLLNGAATDLTLPSTGGQVNISANSNSPLDGNVSISVDGITINTGYGTVESSVDLTAAGSHSITVLYSGNENYTSGSLTRTVSVSSGGSETGSGNGGGGGGSSVNESKSVVQGLEIYSVGDLIMSPGESKTIELRVKNVGNSFLNKCKPIGSGIYEPWFSSSDVKNINVGEIVEYLFSINVPAAASEQDSPRLVVECLEKSFGVPLNVIILKPDVSSEIVAMNLLTSDELEVNYSISSSVGGDQTFVFRVYDSDGNLLSKKAEKIQTSTNTKYFSIVLDVSKAEKGLLKISISKEGSEGSLIDEFFVYDVNKGITGFILFDNSDNSGAYSLVIVGLFLAFGIVILRRILKFKSQGGYMHASDEAILSKFSLSGMFNGLKNKFVSKGSTESVMMVDDKFVNTLKEVSKNNDVKGKWISVSLDDKGDIKSS